MGPHTHTHIYMDTIYFVFLIRINVGPLVCPSINVTVYLRSSSLDEDTTQSDEPASRDWPIAHSAMIDAGSPSDNTT